MKKKKLSIEKTLQNIDYPLTYKKFSKIFKKIKKSERRYFIKLLKVFCKEIDNNEKVYYATTSDLNLNQRGMMILLDNRLLLIHSKQNAKIIHFSQIKYKKIEKIDFDRDAEGESCYGSLYIKAKRKNLGPKNFTIRTILKDDLPSITEFIRIRIV